MRYFTIIIMLLCLTACKRKDKPTAIEKNAAVKDSTAKPFEKPVIKAKPSSDFPADTAVFHTRVLLEGGVYHEDEVEPQSAKYKWMGLFKTDSGYYTGPTQIKLNREFDAVLDSATQKTGWGVYTPAKDTSVILVSGLNYLREGKVDSIAFKKDYILPGEHEDFTCNGVKYSLYATGSNNSTSKERTPYGVSDYKLYLKAVIAGKAYEQLIVSTATFNDTICTLIFIGDIDGDGRPDMIIDTTNHYNMLRPTLYLSKPAGKGQLLKPVGWFVMVGC